MLVVCTVLLKYYLLLQVGEIFYVKGALERILKLCRTYYSYGTVASLTQKQEEIYLAKAALMGTAGLRGWLVNILIKCCSNIN